MIVSIASRRPVTSYSASRSSARFFGSSIWARWKPAAGANSTVSVSPLRLDGTCLGEQRRDRDRSRPDRFDDVALPGIPELVELEGRELRGRRGRRGARRRVRGLGGRGRRGGRGGRGRPFLDRGGWRHALRPRLEQLEPVGERLAREVGLRPGDLDERELERQPWVATLAHVVDRDGQEVDQANDRRLRQLVRLLPQALARLLGDRQRLRARARRAGRAGAGGDARSGRSRADRDPDPARRAPRSGRVRRRCRGRRSCRTDRNKAPSSIPPTSCSTSCTEIVPPVAAASWSRVETASRNEPWAPRAISASAASGRVDLLPLANAPQDGDELLQPRPLEDERLAARAHRRAARSRDPWCRRRRRGGVEAPRSASAAHSTPAFVSWWASSMM